MSLPSCEAECGPGCDDASDPLHVAVMACDWDAVHRIYDAAVARAAFIEHAFWRQVFSAALPAVAPGGIHGMATTRTVIHNCGEVADAAVAEAKKRGRL